MSAKMRLVTMLAVALTAMVGATRLRAGDYPYQGTAGVLVEGVLTSVDADRDMAVLKVDSGRTYQVDTSSTQFRVPSGQSGASGNLAPGMYVRVYGTLLADNVLAAQRLAVLTPTRLTASAPAVSIQLRGTVAAVDDDRGLVTVHVSDHVRVIHVDGRTDLTDIRGDDEHIGLLPGQRVTVAGVLLPDGTVRAGAVSLNRDLRAAGWNPAPATSASVPAAVQLVGSVEQPSTPFGRDITLSLDGNAGEIVVHVPRSARVRRDGQRISVHDVGVDDVVRVQGAYDGRDFRAAGVEVLHTESQFAGSVGAQ
ncbi:MAG: DUF5666 domain-containing protein [Capsulimonadaceae bacterium]